jgi:hypothetical protein
MARRVGSLGFVNPHGQVVFFRTPKLTKHLFRVFMACRLCGLIYDAVESEVPECRCPACQEGHRSKRLIRRDSSILDEN